MDDDVAFELHHCVERAVSGTAGDVLLAARRARELLALLEGRAVDLVRAEGWGLARLAVRRQAPDPPDAA